MPLVATAQTRSRRLLVIACSLLLSDSYASPNTATAFVVPLSSLSTSGRSTRNRDGSWTAGGVALHNLAAKKSNGGKKQKPRRFTQIVHEQETRKTSSTVSAASPQRKDRMWRSHKSIEELEKSMTNRWGTDLGTWTAKDFELDEDDVSDYGKDGTVVEETSRFRASPVKDPWDPVNENKKVFEETSPFSLRLEEENLDNPMLRRVQKNQQRLKRQRGNQRDEESLPSDSTKPSNGRLLQVDHLIASKPAGGRGSYQKQHENEGKSSGSSFFFRSDSIPEKSSTENSPTGEDEVKPNRDRRQATPSVAILDQNRNPIFLTLTQAERAFKDLVGDVDAQLDKDSDAIFQPYETRPWDHLGITSPILLRNLQNMGCERSLSVQDKACPDVLEGKDVLVGTYTGSGKTLAFLAPLAQRILNDDGPDGSLRVLVVAPGRELASQIISVARSLLEGTGITTMLAIGGTTFGRNLEQIRKRKPSILIGTPGRIAELVVGQPGDRTGRLKTQKLQSLVLDEFDALLEYKPHREPTNAIITELRRRRGDYLQSVLCSATASDMVGSPKLQNYLRMGFAQAMADNDDIFVTAPGGKSKDNVTRVSRTVIHGVVHVPHRRFALETLRKVLHTDPLPRQILIFVENSRKVKIVCEKLEGIGVIAAPLHGGMGSEKMDRAEVSKALREGYVGIVVATELAARGLDAPLLTHVINLDLPTDASHYAHRAGRCGRGGRPGVVINVTTDPKERSVPQRFADKLGVTMHTVEVRNGKLNVIDPTSQDIG
jgi:superfamily II DNA/RNA helicase